MEIAVLLDKNDKTVSFYEPGIIKVYSKNKEGFIITKEILYALDNTKNLNVVREYIKEITEKLGECKIIVGSEIKGVPYTVLDLIGFNTWEIEGTPMEFLEYIFDKENNHLLTKDENENVLFPVQTDRDGYYFIDLKAIQESNSSITSKQVLLPFLKGTNFFQLEIICGHIPPWFEEEFKKLNLTADIQGKSPNEFKLIVCHKECSTL